MDSLRNTFARLELVMDGIALIKLADPEAKRLACLYWDADSDGEISIKEAANPRFLGTGFNDNAALISFDEFRLLNYMGTTDRSWFYGCTNLVSASLPYYSPDGRTYVAYRTFYNCVSLKRVILEDTIIKITTEAFYNCVSLKNIDLTNIMSLENGCFSHSGLEYIELPKGLTSLASSVFRDNLNLKTVIARCENLSAYGGNQTFYNCPALESFVIYQTTPPVLGWNCFMNTDNCIFYVPDTVVDTYKSASGWSNMASRIKPLSSYAGEL